jgi:hypothetical protein
MSSDPPSISKVGMKESSQSLVNILVSRLVICVLEIATSSSPSVVPISFGREINQRCSDDVDIPSTHMFE